MSSLVRFTLALLLAAVTLAPAATAPSYDDRIRSAMDKVDRVIAAGPFTASWESLEHFQVPDWYKDAKFGIFIHWGVYSVPAFDNEWYPRNMYLKDKPVFAHHVERYGPQSRFGYKDFIPKFSASKFSAEQWADLFRKAGAKFVMPVAEHHDGFPMYASDLTEYSAAKMGPKRDVVGELARAVRKNGMHFAASSHRAEHWWFYNGGMTFDSDVKDSKYSAFYGPAQSDKVQPDDAFLRDWLARSCEIVDKYQPEVVWFDWWIEQPAFQPYLKKFAAYYYNRGAQWKKGVAINFKNKAIPEKAAVLDIERGQLDSLHPNFWQTDTSISVKSWGYIENDSFKSADSIVDQLVDIVSKNGALLLNVGPRPDGTIPEQAQSTLLEIGKWLAVNGEAVYGTRPWKVFGEGPTQVVGGSFKDTATKPYTGEDIRYTTKGSTLYAIALAWPADGKLLLKSVTGRPVHSVRLLGASGSLPFEATDAGLRITLPAAKPNDFAYAFVLR